MGVWSNELHVGVAREIIASGNMDINRDVRSCGASSCVWWASRILDSCECRDWTGETCENEVKAGASAVGLSCVKMWFS